MIISQLLKPNFRSTLFPLLIALQISACTTEDPAATATELPNISNITDTNIGSDIKTDPVSNQVAMYSYNANLSDAQPLSGAVLEQTTVYMFFNNTPQYSSMNFYCCKGIDGASTGEAHKAAVRDSSAPFVYAVDLSQYSTAGTRELYVDRTRTDGSGIENIYVNFSIDTSIISITPTPNTPAVISGTSSASVTEDVDPDGDNLLEASAKLNITDSDAGEAAFIAKTVTGNYGSLTINDAGNWNYAANNNQAAIQNLAGGATLKDSLTVSSIDGTTKTVVITIIGVNEVTTNKPAVISGTSSASVTEDVDPDGDNLLEASAKLNITDSDAGEAAFIAKTVTGNYGSLTINSAGNWNYAANNNQAAIQNLAGGATLKDSLTVSSIDGTTKTVVITIIGVNETGTIADINLSWVAPAEREDNTPISLSEIAGYKIYYGTKQGQYTNSVDINDGSAEGYTFKAFPSGTYFFVVTTLDTDGRESQYSPEVKKIN